jgi:hypothetical protein
VRAYEVETEALVREFKKAAQKRRASADEVVEAFRNLSGLPALPANVKPRLRRPRKPAK